MGKMSDVGWMALFAAREATDGVASIRLEEAQAYVEVGDRVGISEGPARRAGGVIERLSPRRAGCGAAMKPGPRPTRDCTGCGAKRPSTDAWRIDRVCGIMSETAETTGVGEVSGCSDAV